MFTSIRRYPDDRVHDEAVVNRVLQTKVDDVPSIGVNSEADAMSTTAVGMPLELMRCPVSRETLQFVDEVLVSESGRRYSITASGIPLFAAELCSDDARRQQAHYDSVASAYLTNLGYPHTQEYMAYLDRVFLNELNQGCMGTCAEVCCGQGEAFTLLAGRIHRGIGVDVSVQMLEAAVRKHSDAPLAFVQGDATTLPLASESFDAVFMLGGIHHVNDRSALFQEIARILKPGGHFYWREPVSDFFLWRGLRALIYRLSPLLDANTERPLLYEETVPILERVGLEVVSWKTYGFLGFCIFMNSDVLVFNRLFRFLPGIRPLTRLATRLDDLTTRFPGLRRSGLQVVGVAAKPTTRA